MNLISRLKIQKDQFSDFFLKLAYPDRVDYINFFYLFQRPKKKTKYNSDDVLHNVIQTMHYIIYQPIYLYSFNFFGVCNVLK